MSAKHDAIVVGGGVVGVSAAYFLARQGARVLLLERGELASGSSYGNAGLVVPSFLSPMPCPESLRMGLFFLLDREAPLRIKPRTDLGFLSWMQRFVRSCTRSHHRRGMELFNRINREGLAIYKELAELGAGAFEFSQRGLLYLFLTEKVRDHTFAEVDHLAAHGIQARRMGGEEVREFEPASGPEVKGGLYFEGDCSFRPAEFVRWLADRAREAGAEILTGAEVYGFSTEGREIRSAQTTRGDFRADSFVLAAGAWQPVLTRLLGRRLPLEGAKGYSLALDLPETAPARPLILEERHIAVTPYRDFLRITGILDLTGLDLAIDPKRLGLVQPQAGEYLPGVRGLRPREIWRGLRPCSPDGLPMVGRLDPYRNLYLGGGHDTKGMSLGPLTGHYLARLINGQGLGGLEETLSPNRF